MKTEPTTSTHRTSTVLPRRKHASAPSRRQQGAATLVVVMLLFFVVSLVAGYASRNLIFEQRTSANQYRSTQSMEAAEAGLEWVQVMLNSGRINSSCQPTTDTTLNSFRQRYLNTNLATGTVLRNVGQQIRAACTFNGTSWVCICPTAALDASSLPLVGPAFSVRFVHYVGTDRPGFVRAEINGCSSYEIDCITAGNEALTGSCRSTLCSLLSLHSGAKAPPAAAVTARGSITGSALTAANQATTTGGLTLHAGGVINVVAATLSSLPGTPPAASLLAGDAALSGLAVDTGTCLDCTFASVFGLSPNTYRRQGGMLEVDCSAACNAAAVNAALISARGRMVWLRNAGGLRLSASTEQIGDANDPVVVVVEGPLVIDSTATSMPDRAKIFGLVYAASADISGGEIRGALVSAGNVVANGTGVVAYDAGLLDRLNRTAGSYVRVPGAWRDFP